jgi:tetratricopeptide (TPR) repeat protein
LLAACRRNAASNLERGDRMLATGQNKQALVEFQSAIELEPSAHAERGLGLAYEALSAYGLAQRHLSAALEAKPEDPEGHVALARVLTRFGQYDKARAELVKALEQDPDAQAALLLFGVYAETRQQLQQAVDALEGYEERQKKGGRALEHAERLIYADLLARTNRVEAAREVEQSARLAALSTPALTLELARACADRESHALARSLLVPIVAAHPEDTSAWQVLAGSALELGDIAATRAAMQHLPDRDRDPEVQLLSARLGLATGVETGPTAKLRALLEQIPPDQAHARARMRRFLADALRAQHEPDEAEAELGRLLAEQPRDLEGSLALGELQLERGQPERALQVLSELTDQHGQLGRVYALMGRAELALGRLDSAEVSFRRLWELAPHEPDARHWLAIALWRRGQLDQARRLLDGNVKRFPGHVDSVNALAKLLELSAGAADANAFMLDHGSKHPDILEVAEAEGDWLLEHGETERALVAYRRALSQNPSYFPALQTLAHFYVSHDKASLARSLIDAALMHDPKDVRVLLFAARASSDARLYDQARQYAERALGEDPEQPLTLAENARIEAEGFRDFARAKQLVARAYAAAPRSTEVLDARGWVSHLAGQSELAVADLERAAEQDTDNARVLYHLAAALLSAGQPAAAHEKFARVLSLDPGFPTAREIRTVLARR